MRRSEIDVLCLLKKSNGRILASAQREAVRLPASDKVDNTPRRRYEFTDTLAVCTLIQVTIVQPRGEVRELPIVHTNHWSAGKMGRRNKVIPRYASLDNNSYDFLGALADSIGIVGNIEFAGRKWTRPVFPQVTPLFCCIQGESLQPHVAPLFSSSLLNPSPRLSLTDFQLTSSFLRQARMKSKEQRRFGKSRTERARIQKNHLYYSFFFTIIIKKLKIKNKLCISNSIYRNNMNYYLLIK